MGFESRTLHGDSDRISINVIVGDAKFVMIGMSYTLPNSEKEEYWDNGIWLKETLHPALWHILFSEELVTKGHKEVLNGIYHKDYIEMWGLLEQAKVLGWLEAE